MYLVVQLIGGFAIVAAILMFLQVLSGDVGVLPTIGVAVAGALLILLGQMAEDLRRIKKWFLDREAQ